MFNRAIVITIMNHHEVCITLVALSIVEIGEVELCLVF
jgi:hypothetical protein